MRQRGFLGLVVAAVLALLAPAVTRADLLVYATNSSADAGGTGSFDVYVKNTTSNTTYNIISFNAELYVVGITGLTFTGADEFTTDYGYIFGSVQVTPLGVIPLTGDSIQLSDSAPMDINSNSIPTSLAPGVSLGLGRVKYSLAAGSPLDGNNPIPIYFTDGNIHIYDESNPSPIALEIPIGGAVTVPVPEPGTLVLAGLVSGLGGVCVYKRRRAGQAVA